MDVNKIKNNPVSGATVHPRFFRASTPAPIPCVPSENNVNVCRRVRSPGRAGDFGFVARALPPRPWTTYENYELSQRLCA